MALDVEESVLVRHATVSAIREMAGPRAGHFDAGASELDLAFLIDPGPKSTAVGPRIVRAMAARPEMRG